MSEAKAPKVTYLVNVYNRDYILGKSVESMLNQTFQDFELIIVDDGSTDNTLKVAREFEQKDSRVRVIALEKNLGCNPSRNIGIRQSRGEWIALNDSDDIWTPDKIEKQLNRIAALSEEEQKDAGVIYCAVDVVELDGSIFPFTAEHEGWVKAELCRHFFGRTCSLVFHRKVFEKVGLFDETLNGGDEYDMLLKASDHFSIWCVKEVLSIGYAQEIRRDRFFVSLYEIYDRHYDKLKDHVERNRIASDLEYCANNLRIEGKYREAARIYIWSLKHNFMRPPLWARLITLPIYPYYRKLRHGT